jgi:hypothetical protein
MHFLQAKTEIRDRINELEKQHRNYLAYQQDRVNERDHHGAWDVAINLSETECEMAGWRGALEKLDQVDFSQPGLPPDRNSLLLDTVKFIGRIATGDTSDMREEARILCARMDAKTS